MQRKTSAAGPPLVGTLEWRTLFDAVLDHMTIQDAKTGKLLAANAALQRTMGVPFEQISERLWRGKPPYSLKEAKAWVRKTMRQGPQVFEWLAQQRDGKEHWAEVTMQRVDIDGRPRVLALAHDITRRKQAEVDLKSSERRFWSLFEVAPIGIVITSLEGRLMQTNREYRRIMGAGAKELVGMKFWRITHPAHRQADRAARERMLAGETREYETDKRYLRRDGSTVWAHATARLVADEQGKPLYFLVLVEDISRSRDAEKKLRDSEALYHSLVRHLPLLVFRKDVASRYTFANENFCQAAGKPLAALLGRRDTELLGPELGAKYRRDDQKVLKTGRPLEYEDTFVNPQGQTRHVHVIKTPLYDASKNITGIQGICWDVTDLKRSAEAMHTLAQRVLVAQEEERRRIARELHDSTVQRLAAVTMSLATLTGDETGLKPGVRETLEKLEEQVKQCSQEIRVFSYLLHPPLLDQLGLVSALRAYVEGFSKRSGIKVEIAVAKPVGRFAPNVELALFRVAQECLGNIHRHSGSRTAQVSLECRDERLILEVRDQGRGMPKAILRAVQEGTVTAGVGIGLAGMNERVKQLAGTLEVESDRRGTRVRAAVPAKG